MRGLLKLDRSRLSPRAPRGRADDSARSRGKAQRWAVLARRTMRPLTAHCVRHHARGARRQILRLAAPRRRPNPPSSPHSDGAHRRHNGRPRTIGRLCRPDSPQGCSVIDGGGCTAGNDPDAKRPAALPWAGAARLRSFPSSVTSQNTSRSLPAFPPTRTRACRPLWGRPGPRHFQCLGGRERGTRSRLSILQVSPVHPLRSAHI